MTRAADRVDPAWLDPASGVTFWMDLAEPTPDEGRILLELFHFHPLSVEDALHELTYPKAESYEGYLYLVLHGIAFNADEHALATHDIDFFVGPHYLVTVHADTSRSIDHVRGLCDRHGHGLSEGPVGVLHRIVDAMVDNYQPEMESLENSIDSIEELAFSGREEMVRRVLRVKRDLTLMRRVLVPQRDAIARLARREFRAISDEMAYRFRDVHDHVVRLTEESILLQDRVTGVLEVNLATISNRLNQVMKLLTVMSTIFLPLTVLTGMWGMNIALPVLPGGPAAQFWWVGGIMGVAVAVMLGVFRWNDWI